MSVAMETQAKRRRSLLRRFGLPGAALGALAACEPQVVREVVHEPAPPEVVEVPVEVPVRVEVPVPMPDCELRGFGGGNKFVVEAWTVPDASYNVGEPLSLQMRVSAPAWTSVFHVGSSCKVTRLMHNRRMTETEIVDFPGPGIQMTVKPPAGEEAFYFVATREAFDFLSDADVLDSGEIARVDLSPEQFYVRLDQAKGRINPDDLSMTTLRTTIVSH